jgi:hypothetical protein
VANAVEEGDDEDYREDYCAEDNEADAEDLAGVGL